MNSRENVGICNVGPSCCGYHASGGHPEDRHGRDPVWVVYGGKRCDPLTDPWRAILFARTEPFCMAVSWAWLSHGTVAKCSRESVYRPCDCGHSAHDHTLDEVVP